VKRSLLGTLLTNRLVDSTPEERITRTSEVLLHISGNATYQDLASIHSAVLSLWAEDFA